MPGASAGVTPGGVTAELWLLGSPTKPSPPTGLQPAPVGVRKEATLLLTFREQDT